MDRLIVVVGATAVGKSEAALRLAQRFGCEIVSGDSMCVYRGMDIGTAKPSAEDRRQIPHHLVDILEPADNFSVADFQQSAAQAIEEVNRRGNIPLLVGGTGLYVQALLEGYQFSRTPKTPARDAQTASQPEAAASLHQKLAELDPESAARIHPNDRRRTLRALEVLTAESLPISQSKAAAPASILYAGPVFCLTRDRPELYQRIDSRVDAMFAAGLVEEVRSLLAAGLPAGCTAMQAIGYKEVAAYLRGETDLASAAAAVKQSSRRYAKRQLTWFRRMSYIRWIDVSGEQGLPAAIAAMSRQVADFFSFR